MLHTKNYCQYLLSSHINYTQTYYAAHVKGLSHDRINRYLARAKLRPSHLWKQVKSDIIQSPNGFILFDDTVLDKQHSHKIEPVRLQYSGNAHGLIKGIGVVTCVYVNPDTGQFWAIDYRIYAPDKDGKSKLDHMKDMLKNVHHNKGLSYAYVLMDSWYATKDMMLFIHEDLQKIFYCPVKSNRLVSDRLDEKPRHAVRDLNWTKGDLEQGKSVEIKGFPRGSLWQLFRIDVSPGRMEFVVTNDKTCRSVDDVRNTCAIRWKIEQLHREVKQTCGIEKCQCRKGRPQRNHIACAFLVWASLKKIAYDTAQTIYQIKENLLHDYLVNELKSPSVMFNLA